MRFIEGGERAVTRFEEGAAATRRAPTAASACSPRCRTKSRTTRTACRCCSARRRSASSTACTRRPVGQAEEAAGTCRHHDLRRGGGQAPAHPLRHGARGRRHRARPKWGAANAWAKLLTGQDTKAAAQTAWIKMIEDGRPGRGLTHDWSRRQRSDEKHQKARRRQQLQHHKPRRGCGIGLLGAVLHRDRAPVHRASDDVGHHDRVGPRHWRDAVRPGRHADLGQHVGQDDRGPLHVRRRGPIKLRARPCPLRREAHAPCSRPAGATPSR